MSVYIQYGKGSYATRAGNVHKNHTLTKTSNNRHKKSTLEWLVIEVQVTPKTI